LCACVEEKGMVGPETASGRNVDAGRRVAAGSTLDQHIGKWAGTHELREKKPAAVRGLKWPYGSVRDSGGGS